MLTVVFVIFTVVLVIIAALGKPMGPWDKSRKIKRARILSVICILGYVWALAQLAIIISPAIKKLGTWYPALFGIFVSLKFISYVGVWHMKKWGAELMLLAYGLELSLGFSLDYTSPTNVVMGMISLAAVIPYYRQMNYNL
jgi:hypothetical protein